MSYVFLMDDRKIISRKEAIEQGLPRYFTGRPCVNGHISERVTKKCDCVECNNERNAAYRSNPEHREIARKRTAEWRKKNGPEVVRLSLNKHLIKKYGSTAEYWRQYNMRDPEYHSLRSMLWAQSNPDKVRANSRNRKAALRNAEGRHTAEDVARIYDSQDGKCVYCETELKDDYHVDHIMPIALGGSNCPDNIQCLCQSCNNRKWAKHPDDWHAEIGYVKSKPPL